LEFNVPFQHKYGYIRDEYGPTKLCDGAQMTISGDFLHPVFSASCVQHISDLYLKFALRPHHAWNYGRHPSATAEIRR